ncbi:MAG: hypothetical protein LBN00_09180 [Oscillospiraceae bacterium]|jgi:uncharacterized membrane protein YjdF|nr:hypothetical protein [Oscillospiraceae bacterium]
MGGYTLIIAELILGAAAAWVPKILERRLKISIHTAAKAAFYAFLFCAVFLGEVLDFYYRVPRWDDMLHCASGAMTAYLGFTLLNTLVERRLGGVKLPPALVAAFAFCFALTVGGVWELYEFAMDGLFGVNMQKAVLQSGEMLAGHAAVADTMADIAADCLGAALSSVGCALAARQKRGAGLIFQQQFTNNSQTSVQ